MGVTINLRNGNVAFECTGNTFSPSFEAERARLKKMMERLDLKNYADPCDDVTVHSVIGDLARGHKIGEY